MNKFKSILTRIAKQWNRKNFRSLLFLFLLAIGVNFIVELCNRRSFSALFSFIWHKPIPFLFGIFIIYFTLCFSLLFRKRNYILLLIAGTWIGLSLTSFIMLSGFRSTPLTAPDIAILRGVRDIVQIYMSDFVIVLIMIGIVLALGVLVYLFFKFKTFKVPYAFAIVSIALIGAIVFGSGALLKNIGVLDKQFPNIPDAYQNNGFVYCFSCSALYQGIDKPDNYSEEAVLELIEADEAAVPERQAKEPNILIVQLESFFDVSYMEELSFSENPIPNFTKLKESCSSGLFYVPSIGAGTVNTEFEVLSQMNLQHFGMGEYPYKTVVRYRVCDSIAYMLKDRGYTTHAIHNNNATFYSRNRVYRNFGFDTFTSVEYMNDIEKNPLGWAKDTCLTGEIKKVLESTEGTDFVFTVSVQPHGQYPSEQIDDTQTITITSGFEDNESKICGYEYYINQLHQTDRFVGELVEAMKNFDEDVIIVFYGDHLPGLGITQDELSCGNVQSTEYVIWANFGLPAEDKDIYAYQLASTLFDKLGITDGLLTKYHLAHKDMSATSEEYEDGLRLLEYDMLYGDYFCYGGKQKYSATNLQLGTYPIEITSATFDAETSELHVYGQNFTPYSIVVVESERCDTEFISSTELCCSDVSITSGDMVSVIQISMTDPLKMLSSSNEIVCQN
ncbi:MAG: sulfatase-like hydrolase/transferase [Clostridia bacterium]|nr:sulfatase-like hydrolase/transferase [Clostridia bacterium]